MKKLLITVTAMTIVGTLSALNDADVKKQAADILGTMVSGHNLAFGKDNLYKEALNLTMWNGAISRMKAMTNTVINENKNLLGMRDSTLVKALERISTAEMDLVNAIKITRGALSSPSTVQQQMSIFNRIKNDMIDVQKSLKSSMSSIAKDETRKLLNSTAMFIETTAAKA